MALLGTGSIGCHGPLVLGVAPQGRLALSRRGVAWEAVFGRAFQWQLWFGYRWLPSRSVPRMPLADKLVIGAQRRSIAIRAEAAGPYRDQVSPVAERQLGHVAHRVSTVCRVRDGRAKEVVGKAARSRSVMRCLGVARVGKRVQGSCG